MTIPQRALNSGFGRHALQADGSATAALSLPAAAAGEAVIVLRPQQRLDRAVLSRCGLLSIRSGMLALECTPTRDRRQILEFLLGDDVIDVPIVVHSPNVSLRAITRATLLTVSRIDTLGMATGRSAEDLVAHSQHQLAQAHVHKLMLGHLDAEERVASLMLTLALRKSRDDTTHETEVPLPMSRDDIADHLAINRDTLSRVMQRLETHGVIVRLNRHSVRVIDRNAIRALTPIAALVEKVYGCGPPPAAAA